MTKDIHIPILNREVPMSMLTQFPSQDGNGRPIEINRGSLSLNQKGSIRVGYLTYGAAVDAFYYDISDGKIRHWKPMSDYKNQAGVEGFLARLRRAEISIPNPASFERVKEELLPVLDQLGFNLLHGSLEVVSPQLTEGKQSQAELYFTRGVRVDLRTRQSHPLLALGSWLQKQFEPANPA